MFHARNKLRALVPALAAPRGGSHRFGTYFAALIVIEVSDAQCVRSRPGLAESIPPEKEPHIPNRPYACLADLAMPGLSQVRLRVHVFPRLLPSPL